MDAEFTLDRISPHQQSDWMESQHMFAASFMAMQQVIAANQIKTRWKNSWSSSNNSPKTTLHSYHHLTNDTLPPMRCICEQQHTGIFLQHTALPRKLVITGITVSVERNNAGPFLRT